VMALNGLFILITSHGLEYPDFYNKLYALLEPSIFVSKHRARFFELMDSSLKSSHLPAYLAAAFAKKLARLSLSAPPAGCLLVIAMVHNLLRRHPAINCLVHRDTRNTNTSGKETNTIKVVDGRLGRDPFLASEPDTAKCNALGTLYISWTQDLHSLLWVLCKGGRSLVFVSFAIGCLMKLVFCV
jgi:U3 small nucleolar RNA-associated protein 19